MREHWKKQDRPCPPCPNCGEELYDQFWGNGGWAKASKATDELHSERDCLRRLKVEQAALRGFAQKCLDIQQGLIEGATLEESKNALWEHVINWPYVKDGAIAISVRRHD